MHMQHIHKNTRIPFRYRTGMRDQSGIFLSLQIINCEYAMCSVCCRCFSATVNIYGHVETYMAMSRHIWQVETVSSSEPLGLDA